MNTQTLLITLGLLGAAACGGPETEEHSAPGEPVAVTVSTVARGAGSEGHVGTLEADETARIATRISGLVSQVPVFEGTAVSAGDVLVRLDATDLTAALRAAESNERLAERSHDRVAALAADGAASRQELDEAEARLQAARSATEAARAQLEYAVIRAPFSGVVTARHTDPGALAVPGQPLLTLQSGRAGTVRVALPAALWAEVPPGRVIEVSDGDWTTEGTVTRRAPAIGDASRRFEVELAVETGPEVPIAGSHVDIHLHEAGDATLWIPVDALVTRGQLTGVWMVQDDRLKLRWLRTGRREGDRVEVLAGVAEGDRIVRAPAAMFTDGQPVSDVELRPWDPELPRTTTGSGEATS